MDVMFLQEASAVKWKMRGEYQMAHNKSDSFIFYKPSVFGNID